MISFIPVLCCHSCPTQDQWSPCSCTEDEDGIQITCSGDGLGDIDIDLLQAFQELEVFLPPSTVIKLLKLEALHNEQIPEGATRDFQFETINIQDNQNLMHIHPEAFRGSAEETKLLAIASNPNLELNTPNQHSFFDLVEAFNNLESVRLLDSTLISIPEGAFTKSQNLKELIFMFNNLSEIGHSAFAQLSKLSVIWVSDNLLSSAGLSNSAFEGINPTANLSFFDNSFRYLDEAKFKNHLDTTEGVLEVREYFNPLLCDARADWLCGEVENYREKLIGFECLWNYCEAGAGTTTTTHTTQTARTTTTTARTTTPTTKPTTEETTTPSGSLSTKIPSQGWCILFLLGLLKLQ